MANSIAGKKTALVVSALLGAAAGTAALWAWRDYKAWLALGPGGLPTTWAGWWQTTRWRLQATDPLSTSGFFAAGAAATDEAFLASLPPRATPRPKVAPHPVPHRQLGQRIPEELRSNLNHVFDSVVSGQPGLLCYLPSHFEKRNQAVTLCGPNEAHQDACASHGEIGHIHPSDGSMHMILSPSDAKTVVEAGWGERHGLAGITLGLPRTYLMIYAPQTAEHAQVIGHILGAAVSYMSQGASPQIRATAAV